MEELKFLYSVFLGLGATLGFALAGFQVYAYLTSGAKIIAVVLEKSLSGGIYTSSKEKKGNQIDRYSSPVEIKVQLQNAGTELTSVVTKYLIHPEGTRSSPKITKLAEFGRSGTNFQYRVADDNTLALPSGAATVELFEFDIDCLMSDLKNSKPFTLVIEFVNHKPVELQVVFELPA